MIPTQRGATPDAPALKARSSIAGLDEAFTWAVERSLAWVRTDPTEMASYWAGLLDRPMFYSRDVAHQLLGAHLLGLDRENLAMMQHFAASSTDARRLYPLWSFTFDGEPAALDYGGDDDFVRETPVVYELVEKTLEQYLWTGDAAWVADPALASFRTNILRRFAADHDVLGNGLAGEDGSGDIFDGRATYNERPDAPPPLIGADGVSSQWAALDTAARVLPYAVAAGVVPDDGLAEEARHEADRIRAVFTSAWWSEIDQRFASGQTADGYDTAFSLEPSWFPAVKKIMPAGQRSDAHLRFIAEQLRVAPPENIEAFTYLPEAFFAYHHDAEAQHWIDHLVASRADYPEVPFTLVAHLTTGLAGIQPTGPNTIVTESHLPDGHWNETAGIPFGRTAIAVRTEGRTATTLTVDDGGDALTWRARFGEAILERVVEPGTSVTLTAP